MWKRETPATPRSRRGSTRSARWLSINQSAFWAGFMDDGFRSKPVHHDRFARAAFDSPCCRQRCETGTGARDASSALRKLAAKASLATASQSCILRLHSIRRLKKLPNKRLPEPRPATSGRTMMHYHVLSHAKSAALAGLLAVALASTAQRAEEIRSGRHRYRDQDRQYHALFGAGIGLCHDRQDRGRLFQQDQCRRRHQRPQDQFHLL